MVKDRKQFMVKMLALSFACCMVAAVGTSCGDGNADSGSDSTGSDSSVQDYGEAGTYYSLTNGESSRLTLEGGAFTLEIGGERIEGTYTYDGETMSFLPSSGSVSGVTYEGGEIRLTYGGTEYVFDKTAVYGVTYSVEGETETEYVKSGETAERPADPEKEGYIFAGWYTDSEYRTSFSFSQPITRDITLYARFVEALKGPFEFTVTFDLNYEGAGEAPEAMETTEGKVYNLPEAEREGYEFVGWWTSDYGDGEKLTGRYEEEELEGNTTLYAKWREEGSGTPAVTVKESGISWTAVGVNSQYTVTVRSAEGRVLLNQMTPSTSYAFDFAEEEAGDYEVTVAVFGGESETAYYRNKALAGVSIFKTEGNILQFNPIEGAERYVLEIECGNGTHENERIELGSATQYDFSACDMQDGGIVFTVYAEAEGYISSEAEYVFEQNLEAVTAVSFDGETETASWAAVENAESYYVRVEVDGAEVFAGNIGNELRYCVKTYGPGEIVIEVTPVAKMYNSPTGTEYTYTKATPATPTGLRVEGTEIVWNEAAGATGYVVKIGEAEHTVTGTRYEFTEEDYVEGVTAYEISVKAVGSAGESVYSDVLTANYGGMSEEVRYAGNVVSWEAVFGIEKYVVQVNDGEEIEVADGTSCEIELTKAGENIIRVCSVDAEGKRSEWVTTTVTGYEISFVTDTETGVDSVYRATGDKLNLPTELERTGYDFSGWYSEPDGGGTAYGEGAFEGEQGMTLYANWTGKEYEITFVVGSYGQEDVEKVKVRYGESFELPVAESYSDTMAFGGWYTEANGEGFQITDYEGKSVLDWNYTKNYTLYAYWAEIFSFNQIQGGYSVSAGEGIDFVRVVTIPETYRGQPVTAINSFAGSRSLEIVHVPDSIQVITLGSEGTAFMNCTSLRQVIIHETGYVQEPQYSTRDGVLFSADGKELLFFPANKAADLDGGVYTIPDGTEILTANVFARARGLTEIVVPASVKEVCDGAFAPESASSGLSSTLRKITFAAAEEEDAAPVSIGTRAFANLASLEEITLPANMEEFSFDIFEMGVGGSSSLLNIYTAGAGTYSSVDGLLCREYEGGGKEVVCFPMGRTGEYTIPDGVVSVGASAFSGSRGITKIVIPGYVSNIGRSAFEDCRALEEIEFSGDETALPLTIGTRAFYNCDKLVSVSLPATLTELEANAFGSCDDLAEVWVNASGKLALNYAENAFATTGVRRESSVETVHLGANVPVLNIAGIFGGSVTDVYVAEGNPNYISVDGVLFSPDQTELLYFPANRTGEYVVPDTVKRIGADVFRDRDGLIKLTIGKNVTEIGDFAFYGCDALTSVVFAQDAAAGLKVGASAFAECGRLSSISLPAGTVSIGASAFYKCASLTQFTIPEGVTELGEKAFAESALTTISIPSTVTYMGESKAGDGVDGGYYYFDVFENCLDLAWIDVAEANDAYASKDGILYKKSVIDAEAETSQYYISALAFCPRRNSGADGVVDVPSTVRAIWQNAFYMNQGVTKIVFGGGNGLEEVKDTVTGKVIEVSLTIDEGAFYYCTSLSSVALPSGLTTIGSGTFNSCEALSEVVIPYTVSSIRAQAFWSCGKLETVVFEETPAGTEPVDLVIGESNSTLGAFSGTGLRTLTLPERTTELGKLAFAGCSQLTELHLPSTLTTIGQQAFANVPLEILTFAEGSRLKEIGSQVFANSGLTDVSLPEGLETIGLNAFKGSNLQSIVIPSTVTTINMNAFIDCIYLERVTFAKDSAIEEIGSSAFNGCIRLEEVVFDGCAAEALEIGSNAFSGCTSLASFAVPANVTEIGSSAFRYCISLGQVTFETQKDEETGKAYSGLGSIGDSAFAGTGISEFVFPETSAEGISLGSGMFTACPNLKAVTLSSKVTNIDGVFTGCVRIETITVPAENQNFIAENGVIYNKDKTAVRFVYAPADGGEDGFFKDGNVVIAAGTMQISDGAFAGREDITSVYIPKEVTVLGENAFKGCVNLQTVVFEEGSALTEIERWTFQDCRSLRSVVLPKGIETIGEGAFIGCTSLQSVDFSADSALITLGKEAFKNCSSLAELKNVSSKLATINANAFDGCGFTKLDLTAATALTRISGNYAFANNASLKEVILPANLATLGSYMFQNCTKLDTINLENVTTINSSAFRNCGFVTLDLSDAAKLASVTGSYVFAENALLEEVILPETLATLGSYMFQNCGKLASVNLTNVTKIGTSAFQNCTSLTTVTIPKLTSSSNFGSSAFKGCTGLTKVLFTEGLTAIGNSAFSGCTGLTEISLPESLTSIGSSAFENCTGLTEITVPDAVTTVSSKAFAGCAGLERVNNLPAVNTYLFQNCTSLSEVRFSEDARVTTLSDYLFDGCTSLQSVDIPATVTSIGRYVFRGSGITSVDISATSVASVGNYAFQNCAALETFASNGRIAKVGDYSFQNCEKLSSFDFDGVGEVGDFAFAGSGLTSVSLSAEFETLGTAPFAYCTALERFSVSSGNDCFTARDGVLYNMENAIVCFPAGREVEGGVLTVAGDEGIGSGAFAGCDQIREVVIEEGVGVIGEYAFYDCGVTKVTFPSTLTEIQAYAFAYSDLEEVTVPETVTTLGMNLFQGSALKRAAVNAVIDARSRCSNMFLDCVLLEEVTLSENVESLQSSMFENCVSLKEIDLPESVTAIDMSAFEGAGITEFVYRSGMTLSNYAFRNSALTTLRIEANVVSYYSSSGDNSVPSDPFTGCANLKTVTIVEGVTQIADGLFEGCTSLKTVYAEDADGTLRGEEGMVTLPASIAEIGNDAFAGSGIEKIVLPENATDIGMRAFQNCTSLTSVTLPSLLTELGTDVFNGCTALETLVLPAGLQTIGAGAFEGCTSLDLVLPDAVSSVAAGAFAGWTSEQKIDVEASEGETKLWWDEDWTEGCEAQISYNFGKTVENVPEI